MIESDDTIVKAAEALVNDGAASVVIAVMGAIPSEPAVDRVKHSQRSRSS